MSTKNKKYCIEALLFASADSVTLETLAHAADVEESIALRYVMELKAEYTERGILIRQVAGGFQMATNPVYHDEVAKVATVKYESELSHAALETLSLLVRHQPLTAYGVAKYRGVKSSDQVLEGLVAKGLVAGTENGFVTTDHFLTYFGVNDLSELLEKFSSIPKKTLEMSPDEIELENGKEQVTVHGTVDESFDETKNDSQ